MSQCKVVKKIAMAVCSYHRCIEAKNDYAEKWLDTIEELNDRLPSGSGFDSGSKIDVDRSNDQKIVIHTSYHHMNDGGYYDGWSEHDVIITPCLESDYNLKVTGRDRDGIKEYIAETFCCALDEMTD